MSAYSNIDKALAAMAATIEKEISDAVDYAIRSERRALEGIVWWCEECDEPHKTDENGGGYFSADDCNETGKGVVLCAECCDDRNARAKAKAAKAVRS